MKKTILFVVGLGSIGFLMYLIQPDRDSAKEPRELAQSVQEETQAPRAETSTSPIENASTSTISSGKLLTENSARKIARAPYWKDALTQGFATYIGNALRVNDPNLAMGAYRLLQSCDGIDAETFALQEKFQATPSTSKEYKFFLTELTARQAEQRQCQGISSEMRENSRLLLERAARGGVAGAASVYARAYTLPIPLKESDAWLVPLLINDASKGELASIYDLACDSRRQIVPDSKRQFYWAVLKWAATNSPESERAQRWLQACPTNGASAEEYNISEELQANIMDSARRRMSGGE